MTGRDDNGGVAIASNLPSADAMRSPKQPVDNGTIKINARALELQRVRSAAPSPGQTYSIGPY
jgi:hypothetical protein